MQADYFCPASLNRRLIVAISFYPSSPLAVFQIKNVKSTASENDTQCRLPPRATGRGGSLQFPPQVGQIHLVGLIAVWANHLDGGLAFFVDLPVEFL